MFVPVSEHVGHRSLLPGERLLENDWRFSFNCNFSFVIERTDKPLCQVVVQVDLVVEHGACDLFGAWSN